MCLHQKKKKNTDAIMLVVSRILTSSFLTFLFLFSFSNKLVLAFVCACLVFTR